MASNHSDIWINAIKEVLAEDGAPPLTAAQENAVRVDIEKMNKGRDLQLSGIEQTAN
jgi:hypothetical protein